MRSSNINEIIIEKIVSVTGLKQRLNDIANAYVTSCSSIPESVSISLAKEIIHTYYEMNNIGSKIHCKVKGRWIDSSYCLGCEVPCEEAYRTLEAHSKVKHYPEGESTLAIQSESCRLPPITEQEFLRNPVAQFVEEDPNGINQHEPGAKLDAGKPMADLLLDFGRALLSVAEVGTYGAHKYTRGGWQHVPDGVNRYTGALLRHLLQEKMEDMDQDTDLLHASHAAWNALARLELLLRERETNGSLHTTDKMTTES